MSLYPNGVLGFANGEISWANDNIQAIFLNAAATQDLADAFVADISSDILPISRETLAGKTTTIDGPNSRVVMSANNFTLDAVNDGTIGAVAIAKNTGNDATSNLITYLDVTDLATNGGDVNVNFASSGVVRINF